MGLVMGHFWVIVIKVRVQTVIACIFEISKCNFLIQLKAFGSWASPLSKTTQNLILTIARSVTPPAPLKINNCG